MLFLTQKYIGNLKLYLFVPPFLCVGLSVMWKNFPHFPQTKNELLLFLVVDTVTMFYCLRARVQTS